MNQIDQMIKEIKERLEKPISNEEIDDWYINSFRYDFPQIVDEIKRLQTQFKILCVDSTLNEKKLQQQNQIMREALEYGIQFMIEIECEHERENLYQRTKVKLEEALKKVSEV